MNEQPIIAEGININKVEDGYVIYQSEKDKVHYLNKTAVLVLEACTGGNSVADIGSIVKEAYGLPEVPALLVAARRLHRVFLPGREPHDFHLVDQSVALQQPINRRLRHREAPMIRNPAGQLTATQLGLPQSFPQDRLFLLGPQPVPHRSRLLLHVAGADP